MAFGRQEPHRTFDDGHGAALYLRASLR